MRWHGPRGQPRHTNSEEGKGMEKGGRGGEVGREGWETDKLGRQGERKPGWVGQAQSSHWRLGAGLLEPRSLSSALSGLYGGRGLHLWTGVCKRGEELREKGEGQPCACERADQGNWVQACKGTEEEGQGLRPPAQLTNI